MSFESKIFIEHDTICADSPSLLAFGPSRAPVSVPAVAIRAPEVHVQHVLANDRNQNTGNDLASFCTPWKEIHGTCLFRLVDITADLFT